MIRKIVHIDEERCNGCGECVPSCAEGAIKIINGKARLMAENLCDGLGACLGDCPEGAITIIEREADEFDEAAVAANAAQAGQPAPPSRLEQILAKFKRPAAGGCPGSRAMFQKANAPAEPVKAAGKSGPETPEVTCYSQLRQWPVQLSLLAPQAACFENADLLIAADCVPFAKPDFHEKMLAGRSLAIACPKLDDTRPYVEKLSAIFALNDIKSICVAIMEVPCCMGLVGVVQQALSIAGKHIPLEVKVISVQGKVTSGNGLPMV